MADPLHGNTEGRVLFESVVGALEAA